ncbi:hypothetical protein MTR_3g015690 [Medicago truncatula]|uniref:Uncharacterized protein n=1 Tax=Medicago truncatula TaxID=3880 RepID=G7IVY8_MEDTR|nr:hypothetical protein MTR_3g015690 [Medicago truncatula]
MRKIDFLEKMQRKNSFKVDTRLALIPCYESKDSMVLDQMQWKVIRSFLRIGKPLKNPQILLQFCVWTFLPIYHQKPEEISQEILQEK